MALSIVDAGETLRPLTTLRLQGGGTLRRILRLKVLDSDGTTLRTVATFVPPLTATATTDGGTATPIGFGGDLFLLTYRASATPAGGLGPYTYAWAAVSGGEDWWITDATSASPTISTTSEIYAPAVFGVTVTDATGQTATATISI